MSLTMEITLTKCFICDAVINTKEKCLGSELARSLELPIASLLEKCLQQLVNETDEELFCRECTKKIKDYDQLVHLSQQIENDLFELFQRKSLTYYVVEEISCDLDGNENINDEDAIEHSGNDDEGIDHEYIEEENNEDYSSLVEETELQIEYADPSEMESVTEKVESEPDYQRGERPWKVSRTSRANEENNTVRRRKKTRRPMKSIKCDQCNTKFENKTEYRKHVKAVHSEEQRLVCDICGQTYKSKAALDIHVGMHKNVSPHECQVCHKKFTQKGALVRHMPLHTGERPYQCDKCGKQFIHYSSFHMHQLAHNNIREKKCEICGLELRSNSHLNRHMRVHTGEKPHACPICGQKFAQRYNMTTHYKAHQGIHRVHNKNHVCNICGETFTRQEKLNLHLTNQHGTLVGSTATATINTLNVTAVNASNQENNANISLSANRRNGTALLIKTDKLPPDIPANSVRAIKTDSDKVVELVLSNSLLC